MRTICTVLLFLLTAVGGTAATIGELMARETGVVFPMLSQDVRRQMVQAYSQTGKRVTTTNRLGGDSKILQMDDRHLTLSTSQCATMELQLLTSGRDTVVAVITTVRVPAPDSRIDFYDTRWNQLAYKFKAPAMADFIKAGTPDDKAASLLADIRFPLITYTFAGAAHDVLVAEQRLADFCSKTEYQRFAPYMVERIGYAVQGVKLKRQK